MGKWILSYIVGAWLNIPSYIHDLEIGVANRNNEVVLYINMEKSPRHIVPVGKGNSHKRIFWKNLLQLTVHGC